MSIFNKLRSPESEENKEYLKPGDEFGEYEIVKSVSRSIIGCLYVAEQMVSQKRVSLMVMPTKTSTDPRFGDRFRRLVERLKELSHPALLPLMDGAIISRRYVLIYEAVPNDVITLEAYPEAFHSGQVSHSAAPFTLKAQRERDAARVGVPLEIGAEGPGKHENGTRQGSEQTASGSRKPFLSRNPLGIALGKGRASGVPWEQAAPIFRQTLECLKYLHGEGMDHLSLTPSTVLYYPEGSIRVFNAGLTHALDKELFERIVSAGISPLLTGPRRLTLNTIDVFSPEIRGGDAYRANSDVYGFGVFSYWMLTGKKPTMGKYQSVKEGDADIPENWDLFLQKSLETDPKARYPTVGSQLSDFVRVNLPQGKTSSNLFASQLQRIPVPGGIQRRGGRLPLIFRLSVLGLTGAILLGLAQIVISGLMPVTEERARTVAYVALGESAPDLQLRFQPERVRVDFRNTETRFIVLDGSLDLHVRRGRHTMEVSAPGHFTRELELDVRGDTSEFFNIGLIPRWAQLRVTGTPGSTITAFDSRGGSVEVGVVGPDGVLVVDEVLLEDTYRLVAERRDYRPVEKEEVALRFRETVDVEMRLEPLPAQVEIVSEPEGATVLLDGVVRGRTPLVIADLPVDTPLQFEVVRPGYRERSQRFSLQPNANLLLDFGSLTLKTGEVRPRVRLGGRAPRAGELDQLTFQIDGVTFSGDSEVLGPVIEGEHILEVEHPDYQPVRLELRVADGRFTPAEINLQPKPGQLSVHLEPPLSFSLEGNGRPLQPVDRAGSVFLLEAGVDYELELRIRDHLTARKTLRLGANERDIWSFRPVRIPGPEHGREYLVPYIGTEMVSIGPGRIRMGSPPAEIARLPEEGPPTTVHLTRPFWIGKYEVTQREYVAVMESNPSRFVHPERPVDSVSWENAVRFGQRLTERERLAGRLPEGYVYRLPTEAEWEFAARSGSTGPFPWGGSADTNRGNFKGVYPRDFSEDLEVSGVYGTTESGKYDPNAFGLYDFHGNVREWVWDYWNARLPGGELTDWAGPPSGRMRTVRGGGWEDPAHLARSAVRRGQRSTTVSSSLGFRVVLAPVLPES